MRRIAKPIMIAVCGLLVAQAPLLAQPAPRTAAPNAAGSSASDPERRVCRRMQTTGSLASRRRQCYTRAEWDRLAEAGRANGQRMQDDMSGANAIGN